MDKRTTLTVAAVVAALVIIGLALSQQNAPAPVFTNSQSPAQDTTLTPPQAENVFTTPSPFAEVPEAPPDVSQPPANAAGESQTPSPQPSGGTPQPGADIAAAPPTPPVPEPEPHPNATVIYTGNGYEPTSLTVKKGTTVTWLNQSSSPMWTASALHPTHTVYPTTGGCLGSTFDACEGMARDRAWSFTFDVIGTWNYHDHLNPAHRGAVIVEE